MTLSYSQAIQYLYGLRVFGTKMGLENTLRLAALAGHPEQSLRFIHVAGTNGKGSSCAMLESVYRAAGLRVGLFTSPHLVSFRERIQVNRSLISEADVVRLVSMMQGSIEKLPPSNHPTFFEVITLMALQYFTERTCQLVIWETGLGGRLDATNIVTPLASVITNIQYDHEKWLGHTLPEIAAEKAGIIKPGVPTVTSTTDSGAFAVIQATAAQRGSSLFRVRPEDAAQPPLATIQLPLLGEHQKLNAALVLATIRSLNALLPVSSQAIVRGLESVSWPGRLQLVRTPAGGSILLDGAHNPAGAESLRRALEQHFAGNKITLILGVMKDKDWPSICRILAPLADRIILTPVSSERSAPPVELQEACQAAIPRCEAAVCASLADALALTKREPFVVVTGSLHLVGEALELLDGALTSHQERVLNEWDASRNESLASIPAPP